MRHIVLLTDGKSRTGTREAYSRLIEGGRADNVSLSTIAIGNDADIDLMQFLATQGGGRYHFTNRSEDIPKLTLEEAQSAGSQAVIRGDFQTLQVNPSPILLNFTPEELPPLDGYDYAEAKPNAQVILTSDRDDPVLAKWQYGLGRVVAWTSDDGADLASRWSSWPRFDEFWGSMLAWALPDPERRPMQVSMSRDGTDVVLTVEAVGEGNDYVDLSSTTATITAPSGTVEENRTLHQTGPGRYEVRVTAPEAGAYKVDLNQSTDGSIPTELAGFAVPPSPELQPDPDATQLLSAIAARSGGRTLSMEEAERGILRRRSERRGDPGVRANLVAAAEPRPAGPASGDRRPHGSASVAASKAIGGCPITAIPNSKTPYLLSGQTDVSALFHCQPGSQTGTAIRYRNAVSMRQGRHIGLPLQRGRRWQERHLLWPADAIRTLGPSLLHQHLPELNWTLGYPWALGLMVLIGVVLFAVFRRIDWF